MESVAINWKMRVITFLKDERDTIVTSVSKYALYQMSSQITTTYI